MKLTIEPTARILWICRKRLIEIVTAIDGNFTLRAVTILFCCALFSTNAVKAQEVKDDDEPIRIDTLLVTVPVIASDDKGNYIAGLKKENFFVTESGEKRGVDFFADEEASMNVAVIIDNSYSTLNVLGGITDAARQFIKTLRPADKGMIVSFDSGMNILADFTSDQQKLNKAIERIGISKRGGSNMQDAVYQVVTRNFAAAKGRKAIIILTDGAVNGRVISNKTLLDTLIEADVLVYPILFNTDVTFSQNVEAPKSVKLANGEVLTADEIRNRVIVARNNQFLYMKSLGFVTGGKLYESGAGDFKKTFQNIADELKRQYVIGFYPTGENDGKPHKITVEVNVKDVVIRNKSVVRLKSAR